MNKKSLPVWKAFYTLYLMLATSLTRPEICIQKAEQISPRKIERLFNR
jgi:hypothetical protein